MALISCPDCGKSVSDEARVCPFCGLPVTKRLQQIKAEEEARLAQVAWEQEQAERERSRARWIMGIVGVGLLLWIASCISNANPAPKQYYNNAWNQSATPGGYTLQMSGKVKIQYNCSLNSGKAATVELSLVDLKSSKSVWSKHVKCVTGNNDKPLPEYTDTIQLKSSNYDVGTKITGDGTWSITITQA